MRSDLIGHVWKHVGTDFVKSFVPAESAELGVTDKILTKLNTQESVSKVMGTPNQNSW